MLSPSESSNFNDSSFDYLFFKAFNLAARSLLMKITNNIIKTNATKLKTDTTTIVVVDNDLKYAIIF